MKLHSKSVTKNHQKHPDVAFGTTLVTLNFELRRQKSFFFISKIIVILKLKEKFLNFESSGGFFYYP